jgi:hypothetical protein
MKSSWLISLAAWFWMFPQAARGPLPSVSVRDPVSVAGIGPIKIGMTVGDATRASRLAFVAQHEPLDPDELDCYYVVAPGLPNVNFMVSGGTIARIDILNEGIRTLSGARIGMSEQEVLKKYARRSRTSEHHYDSDGHYITVYPTAARKLIFETDGHVVTEYRVGRVPEVEYVEHCL